MRDITQEQYVATKEAAQEWSMDHPDLSDRNNQHQCPICGETLHPHELHVWQTGGMYHLACANQDKMAGFFLNGRRLSFRSRAGKRLFSATPRQVANIVWKQ